MTMMQAKDWRCPVHGISICSPEFNHCHLPRHFGRVHDAVVAVTARQVRVDYVLTEIDRYVHAVVGYAYRSGEDAATDEMMGGRP